MKPCIADLTPPYPDGCGHWNITRINVPNLSNVRGKGHGHSLLMQILIDADSEGADLCLFPAASDGLTTKQLQAWYGRHGFKIDTEGFTPCYMVRKAR